MKKEIIIALCGISLVIIMVAAIFGSPRLKEVGVLHEIRTFDAWEQSGFVNSGLYRNPQANVVQAAFPSAPPILQGEAAPLLIKELGVEVIPVGGGKVKITGIMGGSWAEKGGLKSNDIILRFNTKKIKGLPHFRELLKKVSPEKDYKIKVLRGGRL